MVLTKVASITISYLSGNHSCRLSLGLSKSIYWTR